VWAWLEFFPREYRTAILSGAIGAGGTIVCALIKGWFNRQERRRLEQEKRRLEHELKSAYQKLAAKEAALAHLLGRVSHR
jgi:hypothetical protein